MSSVQLKLEAHLPVLRDFARLQLFSPEEISQIVARRKKLLLSFGGGAKQKLEQWNDWERLIEFEKGVDELRKKRIKKVRAERNKQVVDGQKPTVPLPTPSSPSSRFFPNHILSLYRLASARFPHSSVVFDAWLSYAMSLPSPSRKTISRILSRACGNMPKEHQWWIKAAMWEAEGGIVMISKEKETNPHTRKRKRGNQDDMPAENEGDREMIPVRIGGGNFEGARKMLMRALRFVGKDAKGGLNVWKEWIRLESVFAEAARTRAKLMGVTSNRPFTLSEGKVMSDCDMEVNDMIDNSKDEELQDEEDEFERNIENIQQKTGHEAVMEGEIVKVVLQHLLESFPNNVEVAQEMADYLHFLSGSLSEALSSALISHFYWLLSIRYPIPAPPFSDSNPPLEVIVNIQKLICTRHLVVPETGARKVGPELVDAIAHSLDQLAEMVRTRKGKGRSMDVEKLKKEKCTWETIVRWIDDEWKQPRMQLEFKEFLSAQLLRFVRSAKKNGISTPLLASLNISHLAIQFKRLSNPSPQQISDLRTVCFETTTLFPTNENVWLTSLDVIVDLAADNATSGVSEAEVEHFFEDAVKSGHVGWSEKVWGQWLGWTEDQKGTTLSQFYQNALRYTMTAACQPPPSPISLPHPHDFVLSRYVSFVLNSAESDVSPSTLYKEIQRDTRPSIGFWSQQVSWWEEDASNHGQRKPIILYLLEVLSTHPDATPAIWLRYLQFLVEQQMLSRASKELLTVRDRHWKGRGKAREELEQGWQKILDAQR